MGSNQRYIPKGYYSRKQVVEILGWRAGNRLDADGIVGSDTPIFHAQRVDKLAKKKGA